MLPGSFAGPFQNGAKRMSEHQVQASFIQQVDWMANIDPRYLNLFAIPNGGHRHVAVAAKLKREGVRPGVPDLFWALPSGRWHGLFLEMKWGSGRPSKSQLEWAERLKSAGYGWELCYSVEGAADVCRSYAGGKY